MGNLQGESASCFSKVSSLACFFELQPISQKSCTPTVAKEFQIGLCGVVEADLELCCNCWSAELLGERLYPMKIDWNPDGKSAGSGQLANLKNRKWGSRRSVNDPGLKNEQVGPPGQGPGSEASTFRENTDTQFGKKPIGTSAHPPVLDVRSD